MKECTERKNLTASVGSEWSMWCDIGKEFTRVDGKGVEQQERVSQAGPADKHSVLPGAEGSRPTLRNRKKGSVATTQQAKREWWILGWAVHVLIPGTWEFYLIWKKSLHRYIIRHFNMRLPWIILVALNAITCFFVREAKGDQTHRGEVMWRQKQRLVWCGHKSKNAGSPQKLEEARNKFSPRASSKNMVCSHLDFGLQASRTGKE